MALDTKKWLTEELGFSETEAADLLPKFAGREGKIEGGYLRQSDYSRQMNDLKRAQTDLQAADAKLNSDMAEWATLTAEQQAREPELRSRIEKAEAKAFAFQQKVERLAEQAGIDPKDALGDIDVVAPKKKDESVVFDDTQLRGQIRGTADYMLTLTADLPAIADEHFRLTGEKLDTRAFVAGLKADLKAGKTSEEALDPVKRWEKQFDIPAKRAAKSEADISARVEARYQEGLVAGRSEALIPGANRKVGSSEGSSVVFKGLGESKLQRPNPASHLQGARTALAEGRYRNAGPGGVMPRQ